jgi:hypothetical protein
MRATMIFLFALTACLVAAMPELSSNLNLTYIQIQCFDSKCSQDL